MNKGFHKADEVVGCCTIKPARPHFWFHVCELVYFLCDCHTGDEDGIEAWRVHWEMAFKEGAQLSLEDSIALLRKIHQ